MRYWLDVVVVDVVFVVVVDVVFVVLQSVDEKLMACVGFKLHLPFHSGQFFPFESHWCEWK